MAKTGFDKTRLETLKFWMQRYIDERKYPGSSVLLYQNGSEVFHHAAGLRDIERELVFNRDTIVRLYSMTKPITSTALMILIEKGLCHLEAPVSEYIPRFSDMWALIPGAKSLDQCSSCDTPTLHQLLTHTSGLSYGFNSGLVPGVMREQCLNFNPDNKVLAEVCDRLAELPLCFAPGQRWEYSVSIDVIGRVVETISGMPLYDFFDREIFKPLNMLETGFRFKESMRGRIASLYTPLSGDAMELNSAEKGKETLRLVEEEARSPYWDTKMCSGGAGLVGTLDDYMAFADVLRTGMTYSGHRLLSPKTLEFMMNNHLTGEIASMGPQSFAEQPMEGMGFGIGGAVVLNPARARTPGHIGDFGWGGMASTFFWLDRNSGITVIFLTQLSPSSSYPSRSQLKGIIHGAMIG